MACSQMAVRLRQPASTPVTARDGTVNRLWRTPRRSPGVGDVPKEPGPGTGATRQTGQTGQTWCATVSAQAPRTKGLMRPHSSSPRGPRPRPSDTPPPSKQLRHPHPPTLPTPRAERLLAELLLCLPQAEPLRESPQSASGGGRQRCRLTDKGWFRPVRPPATGTRSRGPPHAVTLGL